MRADEVLACHTEDMTKGQAERLFPILEALLRDANVTWQDITRIAVGVGPGNFTGIRIAVAAARGLSLSLNIPAIGVNGFEVAVWGQEFPVMAVISAPRDQVYHQTWSDPQTNSPAALSPQDQLSGDTPLARLDAVDLTERLRRIACIGTAALNTAPPAPLYIRPADAALPKEAPPVILPGGPDTP